MRATGLMFFLSVSKSIQFIYNRAYCNWAECTVEIRIKEPRFSFGSLNRFLIKWLLL